MRAAVCPAYGPPEVVETREIDPPALGPGQVRVRVDAAAVNFPDVLLVGGEYQVKVPPPFVPGSELAGTVMEGSTVGERVFGSTLVGAFAEEAVLDRDCAHAGPRRRRHGCGRRVRRRPPHRVQRPAVGRRAATGEELVVLGAGGGVGLAAVQLGAVLGATVTAVASSAEKLAAAEAAGASRLVDHRAGDLRQALKDTVPDGADVVVDPVGGDLAEPALRCLRYGGRFVTVGYASGVIPRIPLNLVLLKGVQILGFEFLAFATHHAAELQRNERELLALLAEGRAVPHIGARFGLDDAAAALRHVADGRAIGKVVIRIRT